MRSNSKSISLVSVVQLNSLLRVPHPVRNAFPHARYKMHAHNKGTNR
jgi:hypothetical protein